MTLQAIKWEGRKLEILDQTLLPAISKYISVKGVEDGWKVINRMQVRGAPAIAIVGCLSLAAEIDGEIFTDKKVLRQEIEGKLNYLVSARPTAVNIKLAAEYLIGLANKLSEDNEVSPSMMKDQFLKTIETMLEKDLADNNAIGKYGSEEILKSVPNDALVRVITHCNTGSLATAGYGTALGVIRSLHGKDRLEQVYCTETRPFNQGARLTSYELVHDKIPGVLICDDMVASLMKSRTINAVIVGADRVVANGDTANKIGTYQTSASTKTTTMTTAAKLYGKDLSEYDDVDVDELLSQLTPEEINILAKEVDPDDSFMPPSQRCSYECDKSPTGPLNRKKLIEHINKQALETPDIPELKPFVPGVIRGKKWVPPPQDNIKEKEAEEQIAIDLGDEYEQALSSATQEEIIDLAAILGFHSMMNQDQYHASLLNSGQPVGMGWDGITKASQPKVYPVDPPNDTDVDETIRKVREDNPSLQELNWNNIKNISDEKFIQLFEGLEMNSHLESLSLTNVGLTDKTGQRLADAIEKNSTLRVLNVETNFINPPVIVKLVRALLKTKSIEEFRCSNQRSQVLGNKIEMEITQLVEQNPSLLRLGLHLEFNDARHRVAAHLQRNIDRIRQSRLEVATS